MGANAETGETVPSDALFVAMAYKKRRLYVFSHLDPIADT